MLKWNPDLGWPVDTWEKGTPIAEWQASALATMCSKPSARSPEKEPKRKPTQAKPKRTDSVDVFGDLFK
jgi:hypothetical protein